MNVNLIKTSFILIAGLMVMFVGCEKCENITPTKEIDYKKIGTEHNRIVKEVISQTEKSDPTIEDLYYLVLENIEDSTIRNNPPATVDECELILDTYDCFSYEKLDELFADGYISQKQKDVIEETYTALESFSSMAEQLSALEQIEYYIENEETLSDTDRDVLMTFISVAQSSCILWTNMLGDGTKEGIGQIVLADAIGGAFGLFHGVWGALLWGPLASLGMWAKLELQQ